MKKAFLLILNLFFFIFLLNFVSAIGIGPPRVNLDFTPNLETEIEYVIANNVDFASRIDLYVKGDLSQYITFEKTSFTLDAGKRTNVIAHIKLPSQIDIPGNHDIRIGATSSPLGAQQGTVGAKAAVESQLNIFVPYEGKYLTASLEATDAEIGNRINFTIHISNKGLENISNVNAEIDIYFNDKMIDAVTTEGKSLDAGEEGILSASWTASGSPGIYKAVAKINYDGNSKEVETSFKVGQVLAEIENITVSKFSKGEIAKIAIKVKNYWSETIGNAYANVDIFDNNSLISTVKSSSSDIGSFATADLNVFWDTKDIKEGEYRLKATLYYLDKTAEKEFIIEVKKESNISQWFLVIIAAVLIYIIWNLFKSGKKVKRKKK